MITPPILINILRQLKSHLNILKYKQLIENNNELKNIHKGKRCFILGSGPSIIKEDLLPLSNEIVFALNNFYVHKDFKKIMDGNKPKYYMTAPIHLPQSELEWLYWFQNMQLNMPINARMIFGLNNCKINIKYIFDKYQLFHDYKISWYYAGTQFIDEYFQKSAMDITKSTYIGESVSIYALIFALYMGFDEIYLLGMDHDYFLYDDENKMRMYSQAIHQKDELKRTFGDSFYIEEFLRQHNIFKKYKAFSDNTDCKIYNASNGGILKVFPRVRFNEII